MPDLHLRLNLKNLNHVAELVPIKRQLKISKHLFKYPAEPTMFELRLD